MIEPEQLSLVVAETVPTVSIIIPAFNEITVIRPVVESLLPTAQFERWEIVVIDDGSTDGTGELLDQIAGQDPAVFRVIHHRRNRGYGAALKSGIRQARAPLVATMDADGQHTLDHLLHLLPYTDTYEMVVGCRSGLIHSKLWRMPGKWALGVLANHLAQENIPDLNSGLRFFHTAVIRRYLHLCPNGFSFSTTSTLIMFNRGYTVGYVPITVRQRKGKSTVSTRTGFETVMLILRLSMLLAPLRIFLPLSATSFVFGLAWAIPYLLDRRGLTVTALLFLINAVIIFLVGLLADQVAELRKEQFEEMIPDDR